MSEIGWMIPSSVFVAGLVASPHCVAMCGPLALNFGRERASLVAYQAGRALAYTSLGAIAGGFGAAALGSSSFVTSTAGLALLAALLIFFAIRQLSSPDPRAKHLKMPSALGELHSRIWMLVRSLAPSRRALAFLAGVTSFLLPCLHLYAFVAGAAATGSTLAGAIFMLAFWASTLPALSAAPLVLRRFLGATSPTKTRRWATALLLIASLVSLVEFAQNMKPTPVSASTSAPASAPHHCH